MLFICVTQIWEKDETTENLKKRTAKDEDDIQRGLAYGRGALIKKRPMTGKNTMDLSITMGHNVNEGPTCKIVARISNRYMWTG
jgi:hypothetical protein